MKNYNTYITEISKFELYNIFELEDEDLIITKIKDLDTLSITEYITYILEKSNDFLHKIYDLFKNNIDLNNNTNSWDIVLDEKIITFYDRINKIDDLIKKQKNDPKKLAIIYHFSKNDKYNTIVKDFTIKEKGTFLLFYSSISNKDKIFTHIEKDKDYQKIPGYQKHSISKRLGDKYIIYFFKNITINQYIQSKSEIDINVIIDLLKKLNKNKFTKTLKKLVTNKKIDLNNMNKMFIEINNRLDKDIATEIMNIIMKYKEYYSRDMIIMNILLSYNIDLLELIYHTYTNFIYSYKYNGVFSGIETYQKLIKKVKYWDKTPIDNFLYNNYILNVLKEKFPKEYEEKLKTYNKKQKVNRFNL